MFAAERHQIGRREGGTESAILKSSTASDPAPLTMISHPAPGGDVSAGFGPVLPGPAAPTRQRPRRSRSQIAKPRLPRWKLVSYRFAGRHGDRGTSRLSLLFS
jgi:hypothetical protein